MGIERAEHIALTAAPIGGPHEPRPSADDASGPPLFLFEGELIGRTSIHALTAPMRWGVREWGGLAAAVGAVAVASVADADGREMMDYLHNERNTRIERAIEPFGAHRSLYILGGMMASGMLLDDTRLRATAAEGLAAGLVAAGIVTPTLQKIIGRPKPRDDFPPYTFDAFSGHRSLPSGHTTQAFAVASVIAAEYTHPAMQAGVYGLAAAVGVSRMYRESHFFSDVVGGAIVGTVVGRAIASYGQEWRGRDVRGLTAAPWTDGRAVGLAVRWD